MTTMDENFIKDLMDEVRKVQDMCDAALRDGDYIKAARFGDMDMELNEDEDADDSNEEVED